MGLLRDWFGDEFEDGWNEFWSGDPAGDIYNTVADGWDTVLDTVGITEADRKKAISALSGVPIIGDVLTGMDNYNRTSDYLKNTGQTWNDLKYPALVNAGSTNIYSGVRSGTNFVSKNIEKLYSDD